MKTTLPLQLCVGMALIIGSANAQSLSNIKAMPETPSIDHKTLKKAQTERLAFKSGGSPLFYEDFANGLAGNNTIGAWTVGGADALIWEHDFDGSSGQFSTNVDTLSSTTGNNGWMMFDGDGSNPGEPEDFINRQGYLISPVMDLTGYPSVHLEFEQRFRFCCSYQFRLRVAVSTDGFATSTKYIVSNPYDRNEGSPDPYIMRFSIASGLIGGDLTNVQVRFEWEGLDLDPNQQGTSHYFWMVDDVAIVESPSNDVSLTKAEYSDYNGTLAEHEYSIYSIGQLRPITFKGWLLNDGVADQTGVVMNVEVTGPDAYSGSSNSVDLNYLMNDSVLSTTTFTPSGIVGDYLVNYSVTQDQVDENPANGDTVSTFSVSDFIFARDRGSLDGSTDNEGEGYQLCNMFDMTADVDLTAIDVAFDDESNVGVLVDATVYDFNLDYIGESINEFEIESADLNAFGEAKFKSLTLLDPITLLAGQSYAVCVRHFGGIDTLAIGTSGNSYPRTSFVYNDDDADWFFTTETPMVRMNFDPTVGVEEMPTVAGVELLGAFPNPATSNTEIRYNLETAKELSFELFDMTGKLVMSQGLGTMAPGPQRLEVSTTSLEDGVYFYSLVAPDGQLSQRLVVIK